MSLRYEQYNSLLKTRQFLRDLLDPHKRPKSVKEMNERVRSCLKHYPFLHDNGQPMFSQDEFTEDYNDGR